MKQSKRRKTAKASMPGVPSRSIRRRFPQVKHVVDSNKHIEVTVHQRDCTKGKRMQASECALARATRRTYHADAAVIGLAYSYIIKGDTATRFRTPPSVSREVVSFDRHQDFAPGKYALSPVPEANRQNQPRHKNTHGTSKNATWVIHRTVRVRHAD